MNNSKVFYLSQFLTQDVTMSSERIKDNTTSEVQRDQKSENWSKLSFALHIFLPLAGLFIIFKQKQIFSRLLLQLDRNCVSVFCPSFSRRDKLLKWAGSRLPETWSSQSRTLAGGVVELWSDGSLLCTLINSAIPGACPNPHRHWKKPPLHAQAIAYKYLGVIPIFTENDLASKLTVNLERTFLRYLNELQQAVVKLSEKNDVPKSISMHYITRGMGLYTGEQHRKTVFYVYPNMNTVGQNSNIIVYIRGPYATYGKAIIPKFHKDLFPTPEISVTSDLLATRRLLNGHLTKPKNSFMRNFSLPFMQYHKKHLGDNIIIDVTMEGDRAKVTYIPKNYGMYEIIMISNGELVRGCPFNVHILNNVSGIEDSFDSEEKMDDIPSLRRRKILSKTIDFIDEQMPVDDVLNRYKIKEEHIEITHHIELKENVKLKKDDKDLDISKEEVMTPDLTGEEKLYSLQSNINSDTDQSDIHLDIPVNIIGDPVEKQNLEFTNENSKLSEPNVNNFIAGYILSENNQTHSVHKVNYYADNRSTQKVVNNDLSEGLQLKSVTVSTSDDKNTANVLNRQQPLQNYAWNTNSTKPTCHSSPRKLKIPTKFCELQSTGNKSFKNSPHTKYFKDVINTSNKKDVQCNQFQTNEIVNYSREIEYLENFPNEKDYTNDDNNNNDQIPSLNESDQNITSINSKVDVEKLKNVPKRFLQKHSQNLEPSLDGPKNTSPICPNHIVPEVESEYKKMSVAEKRKIFAKHIPNRLSSSTNSSFSESENGEVSPNRLSYKHFEGLSVLNYLSSLKNTECTRTLENYPLFNTVSLPNISSIESEIFQNSVKQRTSFWEKISSSSSSLSINSETPSKRKTPKLADIERCRLIWKKPEETTISNTSISTIENTNVDKDTETRKSADDILSITNFIPHETPKKYKSMDHSLDKCTVLSIEERKILLLKQNYEKESPKKLSTVPIKNGSIKEIRPKLIQEKQDLNSEDEKDYSRVKENGDKKHNGSVKENLTKLIQEKQDINNEDKKDIVVFSSILDRIKKYDSACNLSYKIEEEPSNKNINNVKLKGEPSNKNVNNVTAVSIPRKLISSNTTTVYSSDNSQDLSKTDVLTIKSHFKRAIRYFKNLEEKSLKKSRVNTILKNRRRYSLDHSPKRHKSHSRKGGSLNLPNVSQRFSVNNLYEDVFGNRKSIFKGAANRSALVDALATFSRNETLNLGEDEDDIMYEMFRKRAKTKRRKHVKSIFDIYY